MSYFLFQQPEDYCPIEERERMTYDIMEAAQEDTQLFHHIQEEVCVREAWKLEELHHRAFNGVDIRRQLDNLFEEVVEECLKGDINYFEEK